MANPEHLSKLKEGVEAWNRWRKENPLILPDLKNEDFNSINLNGINFADSVLTGANLRGASLAKADLRWAKLQGAVLCQARLKKTNLNGANLGGAKLNGAFCNQTHFRGTNLQGADLSGASLIHAQLDNAVLIDSNLGKAIMRGTALTGVKLSSTKGLDRVEHKGPSSLGIDTIKLSEGKLPDVFLQGCGLSPWEIEIVRLYDPGLTPSDVDEILGTKIYQKRVDNPLYIGGVFISYSHAEDNFVNKLYMDLQDAGVSVWLDKHDILAGSIERQVMKQIRLKDIVLLVLSENSLESDWVETELEEAREKEKNENRDVLCPVAIDDSWKDKGGVLWRKLKRDKVILDFSAWEKEEEFKAQFDKLIKGMQINY